MVNKMPLMNRMMRVKDKSKIFHSSGYARSQSGANIGVADARSFEARKTVDEKRKLVQRYNNSRIISDTYALDRVRRYVPRTQKKADDMAKSRSEQTGRDRCVADNDRASGLVGQKENRLVNRDKRRLRSREN